MHLFCLIVSSNLAKVSYAGWEEASPFGLEHVTLQRLHSGLY